MRHLTKKCSAAGQTDDGLEPGEQYKPGNTAGPLQRLVRRRRGERRGTPTGWRTSRGREGDRSKTSGDDARETRCGRPAADDRAADRGAERLKPPTVRGWAGRRTHKVEWTAVTAA